MIVIPEHDTAIHGLASRLPGAENCEEFWSVLTEERCVVSDAVPKGRWHPERFLSPDRAAQGTTYTFAGGYLPHVYDFDAAAFGFSPREAAQMDPQQRLLLEVVWEAFEDAGISPSTLGGRRVGVFVGASSTDHADIPLLDLGAIGPHFMVGNSLSILANRISYAFDLHGPSLTIDTACSSSLVALAQATMALDRGDVDLAVVAGVNVLLSPAPFVGFSRAGMLSPTGRCRPFSAAADGYVRAEGAVALVLGRAGVDGLPSRALLRAAGVNSDGRTSGIALPSAERQRDLLVDIYRAAGISPEALAFVEAHGTGTLAGDPVEARALGEALGRARGRPLPIGSVKSNIGHLECVSGLAGLAKCVLALEHRALPATLHLDPVNPSIDFAGYNLSPTDRMSALPTSGPLLAGLCNFGFGGTNAHAVLESVDAPVQPIAAAADESGLLVISAHTREALAHLCNAYAPVVEQAGVAQVASAVARSRDLLRHRMVLDPKETADVAACLRGEAQAAGSFHRGEAVAPRARMAFAFTGNGCQHAGMGRLAWERSAPFRESMEATAALIRAAGGICPVETLFAEDAEERLVRTSVAQPALYAIQMGLVDALAAQGMRPSVVLGHSVGEIAAAAAADILSRADAARLVVARSSSQEGVRGSGTMAVLGCDVQQSRDLIQALEGQADLAVEQRVEIAAANGPNSTTISGPGAAIRMVVEAARRERIASVTLDIDYPFHHALIEPERQAMLDTLAYLAPTDGNIPFISAIGGEVQAGIELGAEYWWANIRQPVLFAKAVEAALDRAKIFIEIGPRPLLGNAISDVARKAGRAVGVMASLTANPPATKGDPIRALAVQAVALGAVPDGWGVGAPDARLLPTMRWNRQEFRIESTHEAFGLYGDVLDFSPPDPLAGVRVAPGGGEWRQVLSLETLPFLAGHRVDGQVVFPATGFLEIMAEVGTQTLGSSRLNVHEFDILRAVVLEPGVARELSILWDETERSVSIRSRRRFAEGEGFLLHARATLQLVTEPTPPPRDVPELGETVEREAVYEAAARCRIDYQGAFRAVTKLRRGGAFIHAELQPQPLDLGAFSPKLIIDPATFDAAFHGLFLDVAPEPNAAVGELPVRVGRLSLFAPRTPFVRAISRIVRRTRSTRVIDIDLVDAEGALVARAEGVVMRRIVFAAWRDEDRIVQLCQDDDDTRRTSIREALLRSPAGPPPGRRGAAAPAIEGWGRALAAELTAGAALAAVLPLPSQPLWHAMNELLRDEAGMPEAPSAAEALIAMARQHPEASADLRRMALATEILPRFLRTGRHEGLPTGLAETWLASSCLTAPVFEAVAATIIETALGSPGAPLRVALLEPGLVGLLPRLLPLLRDERIVVEVLTSDATRLDAALARLGARQLVQLRDATSPAAMAAPPPDLVACVAIAPLDGGRADALAQLRGFGLDNAPLVLGVPPHAGVIDLLHGAEEGWWDQSPFPSAPVGQWPLPAETIRAIETAGMGEALRSELDVSGAGLLVFARPVAEAEPAPRTAALLHIAPAALPRAARMLPGFEFAPYDTVVRARTDELVVVDLQAGPVASEGAALRQRILRLRDAAEHMAHHPGARLYILCESEGASAEAIRAMARTLANEYQAVTVCTLLLRGGPSPHQVAEALHRHLSIASPERELVIGPSAVQVTRARRSRLPLRPHGAEERTVLRQGPRGLDDLGWDIEPRVAPGAGEVEIEVAATGLNFRDVMLGIGLLDEEILGEGLTGGSLGFEFSGTVLRVGKGARVPWRVGDRVMGFGRDAFASHLVLPSWQLLPVPAGLPLEAAAALPVAGTTAWHALVDRAQLKRGETVLIHGGAGAVGLAALGIALSRGARVIAAAGSPEKRALLLRLGAHAVVDSRAANLEAEVRRVADGVDVVLNSVAGDAMRDTLRLVRPFGRFIEIGKRDFLENTRIGLRPFRHNIAYIGVDIDQLLAHAPRQALRPALGFVRAVEAGKVLPIPSLVVPGAQIGDAFRSMQASGHIGKIVIRPEMLGHDRSGGKRGFTAAPGLHVVLGGTRGFGLMIALWLAERGARHVVVASRQGVIDAVDLPRIEALAAQGVGFAAEKLDVTDAEAVKAAFARWRGAHGPIAGVVHAAMVLSDGLLAGVTATTLDTVLAPKVEGIRAVAAALDGDDLQYLMACSSSAVVVGSPGQGAYVAANGFLEGAVQELRDSGVPAVAVAWGVITDAGVVARSRNLADRLRSTTGMDGITSQEALAYLGPLLADPNAAPAVSGYAVLRSTPGANKLATLRSPLFGELLGAGSLDEASESERIDLTGLSHDAATETLLQVVREEVGQILRLPVAEVDADRPLIELGLDSLMALELRLGLEKRIGAELSVIAALGGAQTARRLATGLLQTLRPAAEEPDGAGHSPAESAPPVLEDAHGAIGGRSDR